MENFFECRQLKFWKRISTAGNISRLLWSFWMPMQEILWAMAKRSNLVLISALSIYILQQ